MQLAFITSKFELFAVARDSGPEVPMFLDSNCERPTTGVTAARSAMCLSQYCENMVHPNFVCIIILPECSNASFGFQFSSFPSFGRELVVLDIV